MKIILDVDIIKLNGEHHLLLGKITDRELFPLKKAPIIKISQEEKERIEQIIPDYLRVRTE
jgi:hypothetical protein